MAAQTPTSISFLVKDFKRLETPLDGSGFRDYLCIADIFDLPDLSELGKSNLRDPKDRGRVPQKIREGLLEDDLFVYMNRGLVLVAEDVRFDNQVNRVHLTMPDKQVHGIIDGGHTHLIISKEKETLLRQMAECDSPVHRYVKVEILKGFDREQIKNIAGARNTSNQVREESLMRLQGRFKPLEDALCDQPYVGDIAWKEYETYDNGTPKPIDVRDIISILYMFDAESFPSGKHPINGYRSKQACIKEFEKRTGSDGAGAYDKVYPLVPDLLRLHDEIFAELPQLYNESRKAFSMDVNRGRFGGLKGVIQRDTKLHFIGQDTTYRVPLGFVYPILGAFRALLDERNGRYVWARGCNPFKLLRTEMGLKMADSVGTVARRDQNPSKTGKDPSLWDTCYQTVENMRLRKEYAILSKKVAEQG